ncbi:hypothetical protein Tco_0212106 [Tanacetum coccineum]
MAMEISSTSRCEMTWQGSWVKGLVEMVEGPMIIVVSSCLVSRYRDLQLSTTPTTHGYFNPDIAKAK